MDTKRVIEVPSDHTITYIRSVFNRHPTTNCGDVTGASTGTNSSSPMVQLGTSSSVSPSPLSGPPTPASSSEWNQHRSPTLSWTHGGDGVKSMVSPTGSTQSLSPSAPGGLYHARKIPVADNGAVAMACKLGISEAEFLALEPEESIGNDGEGHYFYSYQELLRQKFTRNYKNGVVAMALETYLDNDSFREVFNMGKEEFSKLSAWKKKGLKQKVLLF